MDMMKTREREEQIMDACMKAGQSFVIDNTNVLKVRRVEYIARARANDFRTIGYFFEPVLSRALLWNKRRGEKAVPEKGILATAKHLEWPTSDEGFDELYVVTVDDDGGFSVVPSPAAV
jgi:predicted kinase